MNLLTFVTNSFSIPQFFSSKDKSSSKKAGLDYYKHTAVVLIFSEIGFVKDCGLEGSDAYSG
ncbi:MAG: hypothetical protein TB2022_2930 [Candidatus Phytoplasma citri]|nr:MAG: hypothetical protein TB2022_2930 [Candidatus Phytoplasma aurantifolia]